MPDELLGHEALRTDTGSMPAVPGLASAPQMRAKLRLSIYLRCLAIQGSWNYEILVGNGVGFCVEPALRELPGGVDGQPYREALARQSVYFNESGFS